MDRAKMKSVAFIAEDYVKGPISGVIVCFHGLGDPGLRTVATYTENEWADAGGLVVMPYAGPWSWMNRQARAMVEDLIESIYYEYKLAPTVPLIFNGGSMGGYCSLLAARYTRHPLKACAAVFPVCDLKYHFSERPDLPRTIYHAFAGYPEPLDALFAEHSPVEQVEKMPRVPYFLLHGDADKSVNKAAHSDRMIAAMRQHGHNVQYVEVPGMGHHDISSYSAYRTYVDFIKGQFAR